MFSSWFSHTRPEDREPLLPQHQHHAVPDVITGHQRNLDKKLHTYLLVRALARGYLPSNEQAIILLRKLLASDVLAPQNQTLTYDGRRFVGLCRRLVKQLIELLQAKNSGDEVQNFLWIIRHAKVFIDLHGLGSAATNFQTANYKAAYSSISTITSLLFQNPDFNKLFADAVTITRQALASGVSTAAKYTEQAADQIEPPDTLIEAITDDADSNQTRFDKDTREAVGEVEQTLQEGAKEAAKDMKQTFEESITPERKTAMKERVRQAVIALRRNADYDTSVSTISLLLKNYLQAYSTAIEGAAEELTSDVRPNKALLIAGKLLWTLVSSFGDRKQWDILQERTEKLLEHKDRDVDFENIISMVVDSIRRVLTDPDYLFTNEEEAMSRFDELKEKYNKSQDGNSVKEDIDALIRQLQRVLISVYNDKHVVEIKKTTLELADLTLATNSSGNHTHSLNTNLISDLGNILLPLALQTIQYIPIPRLTLVSPDLDLLLESIIIEPGRTVNSSSFLPHRIGVLTTNEIDVFKARRRVQTQMASTARIKIEGVTFKAQDVGYIMKVHRNWLLSFADSGLATIAMDERGIDIYLDVEFTRNSVDEMVILKGVSVNLNKLDFTLRRSKFSLLAWLFKPLVKPILRKVVQDAMEQAIEDGLRALNREMIYTRERLRATRIANPHDLRTFVRAVLARWTAPRDTDVEVGIDWRARAADGSTRGKDKPFDGVYAPGTLVGLWEGEGMAAGEWVEEGEVEMGGWKNKCFEI